MTNHRGKLDSIVVQTLLDQLDESLQDIGEAFGLSIRIGRASYTTNNAQITIEAARVDEQGVVMGREAEEFLVRAEDFGLEASDLGREFGCEHERLRIIGLKPRKKSPVICEQVFPPSGKRFALTARAVRAGLADAKRLAEARQARESSKPSKDEAVRAAVLRLVEDRRAEAEG